VRSEQPINFTQKIGEGGYASIYMQKVRKKEAAIKIFKQPLQKKRSCIRGCYEIKTIKT